MRCRTRRRCCPPRPCRKPGEADTIRRALALPVALTVLALAGTATASVPFIPLEGDRSVVIHALATDHHTGLAGARLACLPVQW